MKKGYLLTLAAIYLVLSLGGAAPAEEGAFEYPCYLLDAYDADDSCWTGMDAEGQYEGPIRVVPEKWLVGPPLSEMSGVTLPPDHWVEVQFRSPIIDGPDDDILLIELGPVSEQALIFITDGAGRERLIGIATSGTVGGGVDPTEIGFDISDIVLPFEPRAVRILGIDNGGGAPGFDIANVRARICTDCGETACNPIPIDGAKNVPTDAVLSFSPGQSAEKHIVYFVTNFSDVGASAGGVSEPPRLQDANTFDPGGLELGTTYYWRIDEVNDQNVWPGKVWSFTTTDHLIVDDFEQYNSLPPTDPNHNWIYDTWKNVGVHLWTDQTHECSKKSLGYSYSYNRNSVYSETVRTFFPPQDWAATGAKALELYFYGKSYNTVSQMYLVLNDGNSETVVPYLGDANDVSKETWLPWRIELQELQDIDLGNIESIAIGFYADPGNPYGIGSGIVYFDDIRLYSSRCLEENMPDADFNGDCLVNFEDLEEMAFSWLDTGYNIYHVAAPNAPVAWYEFEDNANDSAGIAHGRTRGKPSYVQGVYGRAISFDGYEDAVEISKAANLFSKISIGITIAFWQYGADSPYHTDTLCCSNYTYGGDDPVIAINLGCWRRPGEYNWDCGRPWSFDNRLSGNHRYASEWFGRWSHWAFTKDAETGTMQIFLNSVLYDSRDGTNSPISGITSFEIGSGWYGGYDGLIDDFRIYDYALSQPEIAHVATNGTGIFEQTLMTPADLNGDNQIDFADFALIADHWLENQIWP
ncbi:MAG TPA: LamG domain-containing protein [Sedimentisphaerales bacterium]|nr:LamG domain-containing protein [Sedimentisphaerales bacterium]